MGDWMRFTWQPKSHGQTLLEVDGQAYVETYRDDEWDVEDIEIDGISLIGKNANHDLYQMIRSYLLDEYHDRLQETAAEARRAARWGASEGRLWAREGV